MNRASFAFDEILTYERGSRWPTAEHVGGSTPYISSSGRDNGIAAHVSPADHMTVFTNRMTIANSGTVGAVFYHPYSFVASDHCMVLGLADPEEELDEALFLYLRPVLESIRSRYNFGREINDRRLRRERFVLPARADGTPDWSAMRSEIERLRDEVGFSVLQDLPAEPREVVALRGQTWSDFTLKSLFTRIVPGRCGNAQGLLRPGDEVPYLGAKRHDYGVVRYVARPESERLVLEGPCIALICDGQGSVGYSTWVPFSEFVGTTTVKFAYHPELDADVATFLTTVLDLNRPHFSFGRKWGARVDETIVSLPTDAEGNPDFGFMRNYIRSLAYSDRL